MSEEPKPQIDPRMAESYIKDLLQKFEANPTLVSETDRKILTKYKDAASRAEKIGKDMEQLQNQIKQAEARVRSMELQIAETQGRAAGCLEMIVAMQFEGDAAATAPKSIPGPGPGQEGKPRQTKPSAIIAAEKEAARLAAQEKPVEQGAQS